MSNPSAVVLVGLTAWTLSLLVLMEILRTRLVLTKAVASNEFKPDNSNLSPFMQRLARAQYIAPTLQFMIGVFIYRGAFRSFPADRF